MDTPAGLVANTVFSAPSDPGEGEHEATAAARARKAMGAIRMPAVVHDGALLAAVQVAGPHQDPATIASDPQQLLVPGPGRNRPSKDQPKAS
jgi:hypothetical protein